MQKHVNLVDLVKSFPTSLSIVTFSQYSLPTNIYHYLVAKIGVDTAENEPLKVPSIFKLWDLIFTEPPRPMPLATAVAETCVLM